MTGKLPYASQPTLGASWTCKCHDMQSQFACGWFQLPGYMYMQ
jgi:hypothetical protein